MSDKKPSPTRSTFRHGDLRRALLDAGVALAREGGPGAIVLREATRRAGVVPNAAYRHFESRQALLDAVRAAALDALAQAIERAGGSDPLQVARQLERADVTLAGQRGRMRAADHQFQQQLAVGVMDKAGTPGVPFDVEGSGYGFRVVRQLSADQAGMPHSCKMVRPG